MSGIYLITWDEQFKEKSLVLKSTKGGYPHMTLAYTGDHLNKDQLVQTASQVINEWCMKKITLSKAYVNSFSDKPDHVRHDVLLEVLESESVEASRTRYIRDVYPNSGQFSMNKPHVTYGIFESKEEASLWAKKLNDNVMPYTVTITGITID